MVSALLNFTLPVNRQGTGYCACTSPEGPTGRRELMSVTREGYPEAAKPRPRPSPSVHRGGQCTHDPSPVSPRAQKPPSRRDCAPSIQTTASASHSCGVGSTVSIGLLQCSSASGETSFFHFGPHLCIERRRCRALLICVPFLDALGSELGELLLDTCLLLKQRWMRRGLEEVGRG